MTKKTLAKQMKDLEAGYADVDEIKNDERKMRVKINQLENDLEY